MFFTNFEKIPPSFQIPKPIKIIAQFLGIISSRLLSFFAFKLFTTPITFTTPKRELPMENASQIKFLEIDEIEKKIRVLYYGYSDKKVLLSHGWAGRSTQLFMIAHKLLENGYMVISFDGPAHGKSSGKTTQLIEYMSTIKALHAEFGPFEAAIGHSFGAMALMNVQARKPIFKCLVTIGSGDTFEDILINYAQNLGLQKEKGLYFKQYFEKKWQFKLADFSTNKAAKSILIPVLVVHDTLDGDVFVSCALQIRQNLKKGVLLITKGLGHTKILRDQKTTSKIVEFIKLYT